MASTKRSSVELPKNRKEILIAQIKHSRQQLQQKLDVYKKEIGEEYPVQIVDIK